MKALWYGAIPETKAYQAFNSALHHYEHERKFRQLDQTRIARSKFLQTTRTKVNYARELLNVFQRKILVYAEGIDIAKELSKQSYHSKNSKTTNEKNLELFKEGKVNTLAAVGQLNEGVTIPDLKDILVMHSYKSFSKLEQRIGRGLRLDPGETAFIHILVHNTTVDMDWLREALQGFNKDKIAYISEEKVNSILKSFNHDKAK
jgi:superfamily II DNA or RNA helicase